MRIVEKKLKENSLSQLKDTVIIDKIIEFIKANPFPLDKDFHAFVEKNGMDPDEFETYAYAILTVFLCGGKSKGRPSEANEENIKIGRQIEMEHVEYETTDKVVKHIQEILSEKILADHTFETESYYIDGVNFIDELKKEK